MPGKIQGDGQKFEFISHMGMLYTILKEILYRFLFLSLKIEDMSPLESIPYGKILDLSYILVKIDEYATNILWTT